MARSNSGAWWVLTLVICCVAAAPVVAREQSARRILLIADRPSHGPLQHEHNAAVWLLQKSLKSVAGVAVDVSYDGWPADPALVDKADGSCGPRPAGKH